mmetsp:Transcript_92043/g.265633  ORF Transcript_92043/g.265633 Transcript_92043/m.265633 type:complete len:221 (-) Transcript_92043:103-765(-)
MRLDEHEGRVHRIELGQLDELRQAISTVHVLELVEDGPLLAVTDADLRVNRPSLDQGLRQARLEHHLAEYIVLDGSAEPIVALREALERRGRSMHAVVPDVRLCLQAQLLPLGQNLPAQRVRRCILRVRGAQDLSTEVLPRQRRGVPLDGVVVDLRARLRELRAHGHEEAVEDVHGVLALHLNQAAVEAAAELDQLLRVLRLGPRVVHGVSVDAQVLAAV